MICFLPLLNEIAECDVVNFFVQKYLKKKKKKLVMGFGTSIFIYKDITTSEK